MKPEEIKIGGVYDVRVKVIKKPASPITGQVEIGVYTVDLATNLPMEYETSWFLPEEAPAFAEITSENDRKNSDPAPKYDPCRRFKKGDRVRVVECKGRIKPYLKDVLGKIYTLDEGENDRNIAYIKADDIDLLDVCHLELVTPVEELELYLVKQNTNGRCFEVKSPSPVRTVAAFFYGGENPAYTEEEAEEAAKAECKRLNKV